MWCEISSGSSHELWPWFLIESEPMPGILLRFSFQHHERSPCDSVLISLESPVRTERTVEHSITVPSTDFSPCLTLVTAGQEHARGSRQPRDSAGLVGSTGLASPQQHNVWWPQPGPSDRSRGAFTSSCLPSFHDSIWMWISAVYWEVWLQSEMQHEESYPGTWFMSHVVHYQMNLIHVLWGTCLSDETP